MLNILAWMWIIIGIYAVWIVCKKHYSLRPNEALVILLLAILFTLILSALGLD